MSAGAIPGIIFCQALLQRSSSSSKCWNLASSSASVGLSSTSGATVSADRGVVLIRSEFRGHGLRRWRRGAGWLQRFSHRVMTPHPITYARGGDHNECQTHKGFCFHSAVSLVGASQKSRINNRFPFAGGLSMTSDKDKQIVEENFRRRRALRRDQGMPRCTDTTQTGRISSCVWFGT